MDFTQLTLTLASATTLAFAMFTPAVADAAAVKNVVLVHGAFADGAGWRGVYEELTKRGYTEIVRKKEGPSWTPTASMMERFPEYRPMGPGPGNPLGTHAMYLSWPAYLIHGTHDTRKIGRLSSDGCIGLYNEKIEELFGMCPVGTQVRII